MVSPAAVRERSWQKRCEPRFASIVALSAVLTGASDHHALVRAVMVPAGERTSLSAMLGATTRRFTRSTIP
ncbi:MAG: hypothetical protein GYA24_24625 [Candidatus Lokiarchaeota archaeon]|nr:hypothetical protein [Candidatus Lokiarchaeota archaeon]